MDNLPLTTLLNLSFFPLQFVPDSERRKKTLDRDAFKGMAAKQETYCVCCSDRGWLVQIGGGRPHSGPFADKEHAIAVALSAVREARPSRLRISSSLAEWKVEFVCADDPTSAPMPESVSSENLRGFEGTPHVRP